MARVVVVGSINMDLFALTPTLPRPGETVLGRRFWTTGGGKGANQAIAAARLGASTAMVGRLGRDPFGVDLRRRLADAGVDVTFVGEGEEHSGVAMITVDDGGENTIVVVAGANMALAAGEVAAAAAAFAGAGAAVAQLEVRDEVLLAAAQLARQAGATFVLNAAPARQLPPDLWPVDVLVVNRGEAVQLTGVEADPDALAAALLARTTRGVALTLGGAGVIVAVQGDGLHRLPAFPVRVVDTTGAGDAFTAGLTVRLAEGARLVEAARFGAACGAIAATRYGTQDAMPGRAEVEALLAQAG